MDVKTLRLKYKERQADIQRCRRENLERERKEKERKDRERVEEAQQLCKKLEEIGGLWTTNDAVDAGLAKFSTGKRGEGKHKLDAIKVQINFRKKVLNQKFPAKMANFSQGGVQFSLLEMIEKLKQIIALP